MSSNHLVAPGKMISSFPPSKYFSTCPPGLKIGQISPLPRWSFSVSVYSDVPTLEFSKTWFSNFICFPWFLLPTLSSCERLHTDTALLAFSHNHFHSIYCLHQNPRFTCKCLLRVDIKVWDFFNCWWNARI